MRVKYPTIFRTTAIRRHLSNMATAFNVKITPNNTGLWHFEQTEVAANKATELLQKDVEQNHVYFNDEGFHNHISHHILALFGTGASADVLAKGFVENEGYQRPVMKPHDNLVEELKDWEKAKKRLGKEQYYQDWLHFYQHEIEHLGWQKTLDEYMFKGGERCEDLMIRMFAGFLHPLIQLMYGVEWEQPAIVAMALAQACVHGDDLRKFLITAEEAARSSSTPTSMPTIVSLLHAVAKDKKMNTSSRLEDANKVRDGTLVRAWDETIDHCSYVKVKSEELDERTAEMYNTAVYEAASAAIYPGKDPKFEFFLIHHVNVSPIFITLNKQDWISTENKVRLLEWKIRLDLVQYVARGSPKLSLEKIASYTPKDKNQRPAMELLSRMHNFIDDGHSIKLFRSVGIGRDICKPYEDKQWMMIKGDLWDKIAHMVVDSVEAPGPTWVRNAGFDAAWKEVSDR